MRKKAQLQYERICRDYIIQNHPKHIVLRIAGSGMQEMADCDLISLTFSNKHLIEVKATKEKKYCFCGKQRNNLLQSCSQVNAVPWLAVRFKRRKWVFVNLLKFPIKTVKETDITMIGEML
jgi:Holliday junction resolvase